MMAPSRDANEPEIIAYLIAIGCVVQQLQAIASSGKGTPDLLVRTPKKRWLVLEVKVPGKDLNDDQADWHERFDGPALFTVWGVRDARNAVLAVDAD